MISPDEYPLWPDGEAGTALLDVVVDLPLDALFLKLFGGPTDYKVRVNAAVGHEGYTTTDWLPADVDPDAAPAMQRPRAAAAGLAAGMVSKAEFTAPNMGNKYATTEVLRLRQASPGRAYIVEACVHTTAPYGDKFRPMARYELRAQGAGASRWTVAYSLAYVAKVNGLIKGLIDRGARDGMNGTLKEAVAVLKSYAPVRPPAAAAAAGAAARAPAAAPGAAAPPAGPAAGGGALEAVLGEALLRALRPWAVFVHALLAHVGALRGLTPGAVLAVLGAGAALAALQAALATARFLANAGREPVDALSWAAYLVFKVVHVPGSLLEVASTLALCLALRAACNRAAGALPGPPSSGGQRAAAAGVAAPVASGAGGGLEGQSGVKYDGYAAAIASAAEGGEGEGGGGLTMMNQRSEAALEQIRRGLVRVAAPFSHLDMPGSMGHGGGGTRGHGHVRHRHRPGHDGKAHSGERGRRQHRAGSEPPTTPPSGGGGGGGGGGGLGLAAAAGAGAAAPASPGAISPFSTRSPSPRGRGRSRLGSPAPADRSPTPEPPRSAEGYQVPDLPRAARARAVVAEVFENERLQPFRGWGHSWPGHFLPTDRAQHWTRRDAAGPDVGASASQRMGEVAPALPEGWAWVEAAWHVDLSGVHSDSVDVEGWAHGLDFSWVAFPFVPGQGRKKMADFVRRRRWLRTRIPVEASGESGGGGGGEAAGGRPAAADQPADADARAAISAALAQGLGLLLPSAAQPEGEEEAAPSGEGAASPLGGAPSSSSPCASTNRNGDGSGAPGSASGSASGPASGAASARPSPRGGGQEAEPAAASGADAGKHATAAAAAHQGASSSREASPASQPAAAQGGASADASPGRPTL